MSEANVYGGVEIGVVPTSRKMVWTGRIISGLMAAFMLLDGVMKLVKPEAVVKGTMQLGFPQSTITGIGIALLVGTVLYLIPRTAVLGAIVLTGYLGGAVASQVRVGGRLFDTVFPFIFAMLVWLGIYLRDRRVRELIPMRG